MAWLLAPPLVEELTRDQQFGAGLPAAEREMAARKIVARVLGRMAKLGER